MDKSFRTNLPEFKKLLERNGIKYDPNYVRYEHVYIYSVVNEYIVISCEYIEVRGNDEICG